MNVNCSFFALKFLIFFILLSIALFAFNTEQRSQYKKCYGEVLDYVLFDPIPQDVMLGESFILRASVPESVKKKFPEDTQLILGIVPQPDPDEFSYSSPLDIFEAISKEGGKWEWKFKAKQHGKRLEIDFRVGVVKNNLIEDNCIIPIFIDIKNKPFYLIIWTPLLKYVIYPLVALLGWLFATIPTLRNWLDSLVAKLFKSKPKNNQ